MVDQDPPQDPLTTRYQHRERTAALAKGCGVPGGCRGSQSGPPSAPQPGSPLSALSSRLSPPCKPRLLPGFPAKHHKDIYQSRFLQFH